MSGDGRVYSQTFDRGLDALELVALADRPLAVAEVAKAMNLHRSVVYRLLRTLEVRKFVERDESGRFTPGVGLAPLARNVRSSLQRAALAEMTTLADRLGMTSFLVVRDDEDAVTIATVEPRVSQAHIAYKPGVRHPIASGAPGQAILAADPDFETDNPGVLACRENGWVSSVGKVIPGLCSIASPIVVDNRAIGALSVVYAGSVDLGDEIGALVKDSADRIVQEIRVRNSL